MTITVGVYLGKKDRFLRNWYDILPRGQFPLLVKYCIQSYLKGVYFPLDTICDRDNFRERIGVLQELSPTQRNVTFTKEDGPVFDWVDAVDNGYRSEEIKSILKETIIHTLLEEQERTPLARRNYPHKFGGYWQEKAGVNRKGREQAEQPVYEAVWQEREGAAALEDHSSAVEEVSAYAPALEPRPSLKQDPIRIEELYGVDEGLAPKNGGENTRAKDEAQEGLARWVNRLG
ncbi:hypothetical protein ACFOUO_10715 [Salinithrix halophila]|uniref:Uncharacterized protein n=2 Tax=Salinithrix halophila TaxID=1485204 RepID=A0ABV8JFC1_9BACL